MAVLKQDRTQYWRFRRGGYRRTSLSISDSLDIATFGGFWIMGGNMWKSALVECYRSWSKIAFLRALQKLLLELRAEDLKPGGSYDYYLRDR